MIGRNSQARLRALRLLLWLLVVFSAAALGLPAKATTQAYIVNPQAGENISSQVRFDVNGALLGVYLLNGTCHGSDKVSILIHQTSALPSPAIADVTGTATINGNVWEFAWTFAVGQTGTYTITVTPSANGLTDTAVAAENRSVTGVTLDAGFPGGGLSLLQSSVVSTVYAHGAAGNTLALGLQPHFRTNAATPYTAHINLTDGFATHRSNAKNSTVVVSNTAGVQELNSDQAAASADPTVNASLPRSFTLGNKTGNGGLSGGINTIVGAFNTGGTAHSFQRSLIVDTTLPLVDAGDNLASNIAFPTPNILRLSGKAHDPDNAGVIPAPGGIASVEVVIQKPLSTAATRIPAHLSYGPNPSDKVTWQVDYDLSGQPTGTYKVYAVITDNAGNVVYDSTIVSPNPPTPILVDVSQPTVTFTNLVATSTTTSPTTTTVANPTAGTFVSANGGNIKISVSLGDAGNNLKTWQISEGATSVMAPQNVSGGSPAVSVTSSALTLTNGVHNLTITATDTQGNVSNPVVVTFNVDNGQPSVTANSITAPDPNNPTGVVTIPSPTSATFVSAKRGSISAAFTLSDAQNNLASWTITDGGNTYTQTASGGATAVPISFTLPANLSEGAHTLSITTTDRAGNISGPQTLTFTVDNTAPTAQVTAPAPGSILGNTQTLTGTITDTKPNTWTFQVDGVPITPGGSGASASTSWNTASVKDGHHKLTLFATDMAGNSGTSTAIDVIVDNTAPSVQIVAPSDKSVAAVGSTVVGTAFDQNPDPNPTFTFTLTDGGTTYTTTLAPPDVAFDPVTGLASVKIPGVIGTAPTAISSTKAPLTITLTAKDTANPPHPVTSSPITISVSASASSLDEVDHPASDGTPILDNPIPNPVYVRGPISVFGKVNVTNLQYWTLTFGGQTIGSAGTQAVHTQPLANTSPLTTAPPLPPPTSPPPTFNTTTLADGPYPLTLTSVGDTTDTKTANVVVDNTAPVVGFGTQTPADGSFKRGPITIDGTMTDTNPATMTVLVDATPLNSVPVSGATISLSYNIEGSHILRIQGRDKAGNISLSPQQRTVVIDNTNPSVSFNHPPGLFVRAIVALSGNVNDVNPDTWVIQAGTHTIASGKYPAPPSANWDTTNKTLFPDGPYTVSITATDKAGNTGTVSTTTTVDNTPPKPVFTQAPADGSIVTGTVPLAGKVQDANIDTVSPFAWEILVDGTAIAHNPGDTPKTNWNTETVGDGPHKLTISATDLAGNTAVSQPITVITSQHAPTVAIENPPDNTAVAGLVNVQALITDIAQNNSVTYTVTVVKALASDPHKEDPVAPIRTIFSKLSPVNMTIFGVAVVAPWQTGADVAGNYLVTVTATNKAGHAGSRTSAVHVNNRLPIAKLSLTAPAGVFDAFGNRLSTPHDSTNPNFLQTVYVGGPELRLLGSLQNNKAWGLSTILNGTLNPRLGQAGLIEPMVYIPPAPPIQPDQLLTTEGRYQFALAATNTANITSAPAQLDIVLDRTLPQVTVLSPVGTSTIVVPTSVLNLVFRVGKPGKTVPPAPITRISALLNAPQLTLTVLDAAANRPVIDSTTGQPAQWNLTNALQSPNLTVYNGSATVTGDAFNGFFITWRIPILPNVFSIQRQYKIILSGVSDVVGNPQAAPATAFFTVNVN